MKKQILLIGTLLSFGVGFSQNTFPIGTGTNVGIGTTVPSTRLQVTSAINGTSGVRLTNLTNSSAVSTGNNTALSVDDSSNVRLTPVVNDISNVTNIYNTDGSLSGNRTIQQKDNYLNVVKGENSNFFISGKNGFVGVNTTAPTERLEVIGTAKAQCVLGVNETQSNTSENFDSYIKKALVFGAGYPTQFDGWGMGITRYGFNIYDMYKSLPDNHSADEIFINVVDRGGKEKIYFQAGSEDHDYPGHSVFGMRNSKKEELVKISDEMSGLVFMHLPQRSSRIVIGNYGDYLLEHKFIVDNGSSLFQGNIFANSNVGIGTSSFTDGSDTFRLSVKGAIRADRVKVYTTWADFVFEKKYQLPTLEQVEKHIQENGHLKDIPSAKEVEENGIDLGEMNKKLLQKVEELTLYLIEMNKELQ